MKTPIDPSKIHKVLLVDLNFMGDMLMSSPVIRELKTRLGTPMPTEQEAYLLGSSTGKTMACMEYFISSMIPVQIDVLCYDFCKPIVQMNKYVDKIYTTRRRFPLWQAIKARFRKYDVVMQMNTSFMTNLLILIAGRKYRMGYSFGLCGIPLNIRISISHRTARSGNRIRENLNLLERAFGWKCEDERMEIGK